MAGTTGDGSPRLVLAVLVAGAVGLNLLTAIAMKLLAQRSGAGALLLALWLGAIVALNGLRLLVWLVANRRYPLSTVYPLTSVYYPLMLAVAACFGETVSSLQLVGTLLIMAGVAWHGLSVKDELV